MTKMKAQLRAEAVERLKRAECVEKPEKLILGEDCPNYWNCDTVTYHKRVNEKLIDLLTDDCGPCYSCAKLAELRAENNALRAANQSEELPETPVFGNNPQETPSCGKDDGGLDSREKLKADVREYYRIGLPGIQETELHRLYYKQVLEWLDRQAAITEREFIEAECMKCAKADKERESDYSEALAERDDVIAVLKADRAELEAKVDELTAKLEAAYAKNRSLRTHVSKMQEGRHGWHVKGVELQREVDKLARENISLTRDLGECIAERDSWRYRWHQVRVLMDEPLECRQTKGESSDDGIITSHNELFELIEKGGE